MTTFDEAARKAADEMVYLYELSSEEEVARIITKHYADLEEAFGLLCELAMAMQDVPNNRGAINLCKTVGMAINPEWIDKANAAEKSIVELLANPRIAALLAEKKG